MKDDKYKWWVERVKMVLKMFQILRIAQFRGFAGYYSIQFGSPNARTGE